MHQTTGDTSFTPARQHQEVDLLDHVTGDATVTLHQRQQQGELAVWNPNSPWGVQPIRRTSVSGHRFSYRHTRDIETMKHRTYRCRPNNR